MGRNKMISITRWQILLGVVAALLGMPSSCLADNGINQFAWELIYELQRDYPPARQLEFIVLPGNASITEEDRRYLAERLGSLGMLKQKASRDLLARYRRLQGLRIPFRADPLEVPSLSGTRNICVLKFDNRTNYTLDSLLALLRVNRTALQKADVDTSRISAPRLLRHIASHELWHCLESAQDQAYIKFAESLTNLQLGPGSERILPALLRNHAEIGADLFATLLDMRYFDDCQIKELIIAVREANLWQRQDMEHYTAPALKLLQPDAGTDTPWLPMAHLMGQVYGIRRQALDPLVFANTWRAVNQWAKHSFKEEVRP